MKFFDNLFDLNNRDEQLVTGLNKELNSVYVYDYFNKEEIRSVLRNPIENHETAIRLSNFVYTKNGVVTK